MFGPGLAFKYDILGRTSNVGWVLAPDWEEKRIYVVGDVKTADNIEKFIRDLLGRRLVSDSWVSQLATIFENAMTRIVIKAGDWHAGLCMVQSIFNVHWDAFLQPIYFILQWKKIFNNARDCYFAASRFIGFVFDELVSLLMHRMVS